MSATIGIEYYEVFISSEQRTMFANLLGVPEEEVKGQHMYLVYTDQEGQEYYLEGGPATQPPTSSTPIATVAGEVLARTAVGQGETGTPTRESRNYKEIDVQGDVTALWELMKTHVQAIEEADITYSFYPGPNSNSVIASALNAIGIDVTDVIDDHLKERPQEITGYTNIISEVEPSANIITVEAAGDVASDTAGTDIIRVMNDTNTNLVWSGGSDVIKTGEGLDSLSMSLALESVDISTSPMTETLRLQTAQDVVTTTNVERIKLSDGNLAFDLDGNSGQVARILGAVFGAEAVNNAEYAGIGLQMLDNGTSFTELAELASATAGLHEPEALVRTLWSNVIGSEIPQSELDAYVASLNAGMTDGQLVALAAEQDLTADAIGLVGLQSNGLQYVEPTPAG